MPIQYNKNSIYCCDNLDLLKIIPDEEIDLIYCDILYGTGKDFKDFKDLKPIKTEIINFYSERLIQMKRILKNTGSIYIQLDTHINHWLRDLMDNIFGYKNFRNELVWEKGRMSQNNNSSFLRTHDYILFYTKGDNYYFEPQFIYNEDKYLRIQKGLHNCGGGKIFVYDWDKFDSKNKCNKYSDNIKIIDKTDDTPFTRLHDVFNDINYINSQSSERANYATQKPLALMERLLEASSKKGDLVADFFMGSGSFLIKAKELKRDYIGCDISTKAEKITLERLSKI